MATHPSSQEDCTASADVEALTDKAERCRRLARGISDRQAADVLRMMADNYERSASQLKQREE